MSLLTKGVGQLIIDVVALSAVDPDCNNATAATVSWTDLGETYQLERSLNATTWSVIYIGTAFTKSETGLPNTDQIYYYRVKIVGDDKYSNIGYFQIYQQNKFVRDVGCYPAFNVSPYYFRKAYRQNCTERYVDTIDEPTCKDPNLCSGTTQTIDNPVDIASEGWLCNIHLGFITATKICILSECVVSAAALSESVNWRYMPNSSQNWGQSVILGTNMSNVAGNISVYSANVSFNGTIDVYISVHSYAQTGAGRGEHKIHTVSWG